MKQRKPFGLYMAVSLLAVLTTWFLHELAHWCAGTLTGNEMRMTLNTTYPASGTYLAEHDTMIVDAAGPVFTLLQALCFYFLLMRNASLLLFPFLFSCFYMRLMAMGISFINPNDEARISQAFGCGTFTLPLLVNALLFFLVWKVVRKRKLSTAQVVTDVLLVMAFSSALILTDQALRR